MGNFSATLKETRQKIDKSTGKPVGPEEIVQPEHPVATRPITREQFWAGSKVHPPDLPDPPKGGDSAPGRQLMTSQDVFIRRPSSRERTFRGVKPKQYPPFTQVRPLEAQQTKP